MTKENSKTKRVDLKLAFSEAEMAEIVTLREAFKEGGYKVSKTALLRAAIVVLTGQSIPQISNQLEKLEQLKSARDRKSE
jgi:hypothetical protein